MPGRLTSLFLLAALLSACSSPADDGARSRTSSLPDRSPVSSLTVAEGTAPLDTSKWVAFREHRRLAEPLVAGNLTLWPVLTKRPLKTGEFYSLQEAQAKKLAEVREVGAGEARSDGAEVGTLEIVNKSERPLFVPAGTIVKGGKQDRQLGQDLVVAAQSRASVEAFCVEQGRWTTTREGAPTQGQFRALHCLATKRVRASGHYAKNQGRVWSEVSSTNALAGYKPATGTLMATLEAKGDAEGTQRRLALQQRLAAHVASQPRTGEWVVVGFAYAIEGQVEGVRTFANPAFFDQQVGPYLTTIALESDLAALAAKAAKRDPAGKPVTAEAVYELIAAIEAGKARAGRAADTSRNGYRMSQAGGNARCELKVSEGWVPISEDWTATDATEVAPSKYPLGLEHQNRRGEGRHRDW